MKTNLVCAALACAVLVLASAAAFATVTPSSGTPIVLEHDPAGIVARDTTKTDGSVTFSKLKPGNYKIVIDGRSLIAVFDKFPAPKQGDPRSGKGTLPAIHVAVGGANAIFVKDLTNGSNCLTLQRDTDNKGLSISRGTCRGSAGEGIRIGVTIPDQGERRSGQLVSTNPVVINSLIVRMSIFDRWGQF